MAKKKKKKQNKERLTTVPATALATVSAASPKAVKTKTETPSTTTATSEVARASGARTELEASTTLIVTLTHAYRLALSHLSEALSHDDASPAQWELLSVLSPDTTLSQQEIARALFVSEGNVTQLLSKMEASGWIKRTRQWRVNHVSITATGQAVRARLNHAIAEATQTFLHPLSTKGQQALQKQLGRLVAAALTPTDAT